MIIISHLSKAFDRHILFSDYSLEVKDNEFIVFSGVSGCGKTTLLNMLGGIEPVDSGTITVNGLDITIKRNLRSYYQNHVGFLFQNFALIDRKTVSQNLKIIKNNARSNISMKDALEMVDMSGTEDRKVFSLSGGEQQRIALARLLMKKCSIILADEPTGSLDRSNANQVIRILESFQKMGKTVIMVTHDPSVITSSMRVIDLQKT